MKLVHHPEAIQTLRNPTPGDPWRVLISGCLASWPCGVNGTDYGLGASQPDWLRHESVRLFPFCPEQTGIGTPRTMPDLHGGDGEAVLDGQARILDEHGTDLTEGMMRGAQAMLAFAQQSEVDFAVLTDRSAACGSQVISFGCRFEEPVEHAYGVGVATALLLRHGVAVVSQRDFRTLALLGARVDPQYAPGPECVDHHNHPWVLEHLPR